MIVVISGTSSISKYLVKELIDQKRDVFVTSRKPLDENYLDGAEVSNCILDLTNENDFERLPKTNVEAVILISGLLPANEKKQDPERYKNYIDTNIKGTLYTLEYCRKNNIKKIIFAQSHSDVAGHWSSKKPITEEDQRAINLKGDHAVYIITKNASVDLIEHYRLDYGIQGISLRLPAVYEYSARTGMWVDDKYVKAGFLVFIEKALKGDTISIWGNPKLVKDIVYVKDVVSAFIGAIDSKTAHGLYNVATGIPTTLEQEVFDIIDVFSPDDNKSRVEYNPEKNDTLSYLYDITKAKRDLNYEVKYPFRKMLEDYKLEMEKDKLTDKI